MPAFITIVKSICISLTAAAAVFSASKMDYPVKSVSSSTSPELAKVPFALKIAHLRFSPDSKNIAIIAGDRLLSNWPVEGGNPASSTLIESLPLTCLEWDATGNNLYVGTSKSQILQCDPKSLDINFRIHSKIEIVNHLNNVGLSESLLSFGNSVTFEGKLLQSMPQLWHNDRYSNLKNIPDLNYICISRQKETGLLAFGASSGEIVLVDLFSNTEAIILAKAESSVECLIWVGKNLIATSEGKLLLMDSSKNHSYKSIQISAKPIRFIEISNDEKNLFITTGTETVQVRDAISGDLICKLSSINEMVSTITLSPNGKTLAVGTCQGNVTLWNTSDLQIKSILPAGINAN